MSDTSSERGGPGMNYYEILGVERNADPESIRSAYRRMVRRCHPDLQPQGNSQRFLDVQQAYETLSNPALRASYDRCLNQQIPVRITRMQWREPEPEPLIPPRPLRIPLNRFSHNLSWGDDPFQEFFHLVERIFGGI